MPPDVAAGWRQVTATIIEAGIPDDTGEPGNWPTLRALLPHVQAALSDDSRGMESIADFLGHSGRPAAARDLHQTVCDARTVVLGPDHLMTLGSRDDLAAWTGQAGNAAAARDQYTALLADRERVLGPDHPDTLDARDDVASWTGRAGDAAAARDQYTALLADRERVLGPDHPDTLRTRDMLDFWIAEADRSAD